MIPKIMDLINKTNSFQIIPAYTDKKTPEKPYGSYVIISTSTKNLGPTYSKYDDIKDVHIEKSRYRETVQVQFDIYSDGEIEALNKGRELRNLIIFQLRHQWGRIDTGIVLFTSIENKREEIKGKYEYRTTFDVTFEYMTLSEEREVEIAREIDLIVKKFKN